MLATFVIGLREGLEAALIVGIIAAFLVRTGRRDALRSVWIGVAAAIAVSLAVGVALTVLSSGLPQRQQEMLESVVAAIAVVMVSYMVLWMKAHSRTLRADLHDAAGSALARGSAAALVVMAFLAVIREGFETAVFLLAAFQSTLAPAQAAIGVIAGLATAIVLGYLVYRGGLRLNLSRFFRITGVVLVLVAAGLVASALRGAYEAGWIAVGQQTAVDFSALARPGSIQESLLTGMLGIRSTMPVIEVIAYLLYAIPMLLVVLWPPSRTPARRTLGAILVSSAAAALLVAAVLALVGGAGGAPSTTAQGALDAGIVTGGDDGSAAGTAPSPVADAPAGTVTVTLSDDRTTARIVADVEVRAAGAAAAAGPLRIEGITSIAVTGQERLPAADGGSVLVSVATGTPLTGTPAPGSPGAPAELDEAQVAELNGGRLPVGVRAGAGSLPATYTDVWTPELTLDPESGAVAAVVLRVVRTAAVTVPSGASVTIGSADPVVVAATGTAIDGAVAAIAEAEQSASRAEVVGTVIPLLLVVFAGILAAFGLPRLIGGRGAANLSPPPPPVTPAPDGAQPATSAVG